MLVSALATAGSDMRFTPPRVGRAGFVGVIRAPGVAAQLCRQFIGEGASVPHWSKGRSAQDPDGRAGGRPLKNLAVVAGSGHHPGGPVMCERKCLRDREVRAGQLRPQDLALHRFDYVLLHKLVAQSAKIWIPFCLATRMR
jgi:hypothetical protein